MKTGEPLKSFQREKESSYLIRQLTEHLGCALWVRTPNYSQFLYVSPAWEQVFGMPVERVMEEAMSFLEVVHPEDLPAVVAAQDREKEDPGSSNMRFRVIHPDGSIHHIWTRTFPVPDENGKLYRVCGVAQDVTAIVETQEALRRSETNMRQILENVLDAFVAMDAEGVITDWNPEAARMFGWTKNEALGRSFGELVIPPPSKVRDRAELERVLSSGQYVVLRQRIEMTAIHKDGHEIMLEIETLPIHMGDSYSMVAFMNDITERKQNERRLQLQYEVTSLMTEPGMLTDALRNILGCICEWMGWEWAAVWETHLQDNILECASCWYADESLAKFEQKSRQTAVMFGLDLPGRVWKAEGTCWIPDVEADDNFPRKSAALECGLNSALGLQLQGGGQVRAFIEFMSRKSVEPHARCVQTLESLASNIAQFMERRRAEELAADRDSELQKFVAMLAHDLKTPLIAADRVLKAVLQGKRGKLSDEQSEVLSMLQKNNEELLQMVQRALEFYRQFGSFKKEGVDVVAVVQECVDQFTYSATEAGVSLVNEVQKDLPAVVGDRDALKHLFVNLFSNALKFTPAGGTVKVVSATSGSVVSLSVEDTGAGMLADELAFVFQPFWQGQAGRQSEGGSGLGLYLCKQIANNHGGTISCESKSGVGSTFRLSFPIGKLVK